MINFYPILINSMMFLCFSHILSINRTKLGSGNGIRVNSRSLWFAPPVWFPSSGFLFISQIVGGSSIVSSEDQETRHGYDESCSTYVYISPRRNSWRTSNSTLFSWSFAWLQREHIVVHKCSTRIGCTSWTSGMVAITGRVSGDTVAWTVFKRRTVAKRKKKTRIIGHYFVRIRREKLQICLSCLQ